MSAHTFDCIWFWKWTIQTLAMKAACMISHTRLWSLDICFWRKERSFGNELLFMFIVLYHLLGAAICLFLLCFPLGCAPRWSRIRSLCFTLLVQNLIPILGLVVTLTLSQGVVILNSRWLNIIDREIYRWGCTYVISILKWRRSYLNLTLLPTFVSRIIRLRN